MFKHWIRIASAVEFCNVTLLMYVKWFLFVCYICLLQLFCLLFIKRSKSVLKCSNNCYHLYIRQCNLEFLNHVLQIAWNFFSNYHSILLESFHWIVLNEQSIYSNLNKGFWITPWILESKIVQNEFQFCRLSESFVFWKLR